MLHAVNLGDHMPSLVDGYTWLIPDAPPKTGENGIPVRVTLIHFWSLGCPLCDEGAAAVATWRDRYAPLGLRVIAVFEPRSDVSSPPKDALARFARERERIDHPCVYDIDGRLAAIMSNPYSPGYFVFDAGGLLRHRQMGNAQLPAMEALLRRLVKANVALEAYEGDHGAHRP